MAEKKESTLALGVIRKALRRHKKYEYVSKTFSYRKPLPVLTDWRIRDMDAWAYDIVIREKETGKELQFELFSVPDDGDKLHCWDHMFHALTSRTWCRVEGRLI